MTVAVVILNWNGINLLRRFLPSVIAHSEDAIIYVADNASTDGSVEMLQNEFPAIKLIINSGNFGYARGYNEALNGLPEDIFALLNSDVEVSSNWLKPIVRKFFENSNLAIVQPKILDLKNREYFEYAGAAGGFIDKYGYPFCRGRVLETIEKDERQYDDDIEIFWASGACFFIRNEIFKKLNGFDEDFFAHQEEIDLCWRAKNLDYKIEYCHRSTVYHLGCATLDKQNPHKTFLNFRNSLLMLIKNLPQNKIFPILLARMCLDGVAAFKYLFEVKPMHFFAVLRAHLAMYFLYQKFYSKRTGKFTNDYFKIPSIVAAYYLNKKKKFNDLF